MEVNKGCISSDREEHSRNSQSLRINDHIMYSLHMALFLFPKEESHRLL